MPKTLEKRPVEAHQGHFATHSLWRKAKKRKTDHGQATKKPPSSPSSPIHLTFSFKHLDCQSKELFSFRRAKDGYLEALLERLKALSQLSWQELIHTKSKALRIHRIHFADTTQPAGFDPLNEQLRKATAWQFSVSANEHGRVHGIFASGSIYVVWLDPTHQLYAGKMG